jgi:hypothetical protein
MLAFFEEQLSAIRSPLSALREEVCCTILQTSDHHFWLTADGGQRSAAS